MAEIEAADRSNARNREIAVQDRTPMLLAFGVTVGFFSILLFLIFKGVPLSGGEALLVLLGALAGGWGAIMNYYFGSSSSSQQQRNTIAEIVKR